MLVVLAVVGCVLAIGVVIGSSSYSCYRWLLLLLLLLLDIYSIYILLIVRCSTSVLVFFSYDDINSNDHSS